MSTTANCTPSQATSVDRFSQCFGRAVLCLRASALRTSVYNNIKQGYELKRSTSDAQGFQLIDSSGLLMHQFRLSFSLPQFVMGKYNPPLGVQGPTLDVQVLEGLETYIATEQFLHKLEQAGAEWIDLSEHQHHPLPPKAASYELELVQGSSTPDADAVKPAVEPTNSSNAPATKRNSLFLFGRWGRTSTPAQEAASDRSTNASASSLAAGTRSTDIADVSESSSDAASAYELVEQQPPLHSDIAQQEPFVLVSSDDAIEGMAYYIALYLTRAPEARYMEPKQLQAALRQTFTHIRRSRYRVVWDWGRTLYRWGAVSYSALQLYEHPWLVRAVVVAIWTSSKMALGFLV